MIHYTRLKNQPGKSKAAIPALLLVLVIFISGKVYAQAPGYMGQRFMVGGYISVAPALFNYNANMKQGFTSFNFRKTIEVEYVASRRVVIGLHYDFINVGAAPDMSSVDDPDMIPNENEDPDFQLVQSRVPGLQIKLFKVQNKGALAPLGNYFAWNFSLLNYNVWNLKKGDYNTLTRQVYQSDSPKFMVGIEWGAQKIFFDRIILRTGIQFGLLTGFGANQPEQEYLREQRIAYSAAMNLGLSLIVPYHQKVR